MFKFNIFLNESDGLTNNNVSSHFQSYFYSNSKLQHLDQSSQIIQK